MTRGISGDIQTRDCMQEARQVNGSRAGTLQTGAGIPMHTTRRPAATNQLRPESGAHYRNADDP